MPSTSQKQHNFMEMIAHDPSKAKKDGPSQKVAEDFVKADKATGNFRKKKGGGLLDPKAKE